MINRNILATMVSCCLFGISLLVCNSLSAQNSFKLVYNLLQTNCSGAGCHDGNTQDVFSVMGTESEVYNTIVGKNPYNATAHAKGDKLVAPGYPARSFLLRKIAYGISDPLNIEQPDEGDLMPGTKMDDEDIELVRQWIIYGAPETGNVVDTSIIYDYYNGLGIDDTYPHRDPPAPSEGFQIYLGKILIPPGEEEYYAKYDPQFTENVEIKRLTSMLPAATHHFVVYQFFPGGAGNYGAGLRGLDQESHADVADGIGTADGLWDYQLPEGTAYFWPANTILDLNLHIRNDDPVKIIGCDLYINIYTQPVGTAEKIMFVRNFPNFDISIPQDGKEHTVTVVANDTSEKRMWNVWQLYTHTHRYGTDYDVWMRNPDGSKGKQVYEGFMSYENGFNVGYYRWGVDVTFRYFQDPFLEVDPRLGFIHEAKWINTDGPDPVGWGLTSLDEMMVLGFQFTFGDSLGKLPTTVTQVEETAYNFKVYPNPFNEVINTYYTLTERSDVIIELINIMGEKVATLEKERKDRGNYLTSINTEELQLTSGFYFVKLTVNGASAARKILNVN